MNKKTLIALLIFLTFCALPICWFLFPWVQSLSAIEMSDGTKAIVSVDSGTWILTLGAILSGVFFITTILVAIFYKQNNAK